MAVIEGADKRRLGMFIGLDDEEMAEAAEKAEAGEYQPIEPADRGFPENGTATEETTRAIRMV